MLYGNVRCSHASMRGPAHIHYRDGTVSSRRWLFLSQSLAFAASVEKNETGMLPTNNNINMLYIIRRPVLCSKSRVNVFSRLYSIYFTDWWYWHTQNQNQNTVTTSKCCLWHGDLNKKYINILYVKIWYIKSNCHFLLLLVLSEWKYVKWTMRNGMRYKHYSYPDQYCLMKLLCYD